MLSPRLQVIEGQYFRDLMAQPAAVAATHAALRESGSWAQIREHIAARSWRRIVLTGMGASYHMLHPLNLALIEAGANPVMIETSELVHYGLKLCEGDTLIIAVSQSGGSAEMLRLLELNPGAHLLAVTNTADSRLAAGADTVLLTRAGPEFSVSCKTYVTGLLVLQWLAALFAGRTEAATLEVLAPAADVIEAYQRRWQPRTELLAGLLSGVRELFITGRGPSLAAVGAGALVIKESARFTAEGMSRAAFRHGPLEMSLRDALTLVYAGEPRTRELNHRLAVELRGRDGKCAEIGADAECEPLRIPAVDAALLPIVEILPVQLLTLALAALAGREAGRFEHVTKITATE